MLDKSSKLKAQFISRLERETEKELRKTLREITSAHLKGRKIEFLDAMGVVEVRISRRLKGSVVFAYPDYFFVQGGDILGSKEGFLKSLQWVSDIYELMEEYDEIAGNLFGVEFSFYI